MRILPLVGLLILACAGSPTDPSPVVAEGDGITIRLDDVDRAAKEQLYDERTRGGQEHLVYELRTTALESLVRERVLEVAAERDGVDVATLLENQKTQTPVTQDDVTLFYETHKDKMRGATLEDQAENIRNFLGEQRQEQWIASLVEAAALDVSLEPPRVDIEAIGPSRGPGDAPVTIVEFSDFQCPFCRRALPIIDELLQRYPQDVRIVFRHLPLDSIHPRARAAGIAAACADSQDRFWPYHDRLFEDGGRFSDADFLRIATDLELDLDAFQTCVASDAPATLVQNDVEAARALGISGTPAFLVNGMLLTGAQPVEVFARRIDRELARLAKPSS